MSKLQLSHIDKFYGENHVLRDINLTIEDGDFMTLLGPSGCGKTTTLRLNLVFQSYALWPHMTVFENVAFGLKIKKMKKEEIEETVMRALKTMRIEEYRGRYPNELSGGQQQRVAIARAIASSPKLLLLDEPLSNLDARLRLEMREEIRRIQQETKVTTIFVTHDQEEAMEISQIDTPLGLYTNPIDLQAADFIGNPRINFIEAKGLYDGDSLRVKSAFGEYVFAKEFLKLDEEIPEGRDFDCVLGLRPEMVDIYTEDPHHKNTVPAQVYANQPAGSETLVTLTVGDTEFLAIQTGLVEYDMNQNVFVVLHPGRMNVYNKETGRLIKYAKTKHKAGTDD